MSSNTHVCICTYIHIYIYMHINFSHICFHHARSWRNRSCRCASPVWLINQFFTALRNWHVCTCIHRCTYLYIHICMNIYIYICIYTGVSIRVVRDERPRDLAADVGWDEHPRIIWRAIVSSPRKWRVYVPQTRRPLPLCTSSLAHCITLQHAATNKFVFPCVCFLSHTPLCHTLLFVTHILSRMSAPQDTHSWQDLVIRDKILSYTPLCHTHLFVTHILSRMSAPQDTHSWQDLLVYASLSHTWTRAHAQTRAHFLSLALSLALSLFLLLSFSLALSLFLSISFSLSLTHTDAHTHAHTSYLYVTWMCVYVWVLVSVYTYIHIYIYLYIYTYTYIHSRWGNEIPFWFAHFWTCYDWSVYLCVRVCVCVCVYIYTYRLGEWDSVLIRIRLVHIYVWHDLKYIYICIISMDMYIMYVYIYMWVHPKRCVCILHEFAHSVRGPVPSDWNTNTYISYDSNMCGSIHIYTGRKNEIEFWSASGSFISMRDMTQVCVCMHVYTGGGNEI